MLNFIIVRVILLQTIAMLEQFVFCPPIRKQEVIKMLNKIWILFLEIIISISSTQKKLLASRHVFKQNLYPTFNLLNPIFLWIVAKFKWCISLKLNHIDPFNFIKFLRKSNHMKFEFIFVIRNFGVSRIHYQLLMVPFWILLWTLLIVRCPRRVVKLGWFQKREFLTKEALTFIMRKD